METNALIEFRYADGEVVTGEYSKYAARQMTKGDRIEYDGVNWLMYDREGPRRRHGSPLFTGRRRARQWKARGRASASAEARSLQAGGRPFSVRRPRERLSDGGELGERRLEVLDDLLRDHLGRRQVVHVLERVVAEPDEVEADLVALDQLVVGEALEALRLDPLACGSPACTPRRSPARCSSRSGFCLSVKCMFVRRS